MKKHINKVVINQFVTTKNNKTFSPVMFIENEVTVNGELVLKELAKPKIILNKPTVTADYLNFLNNKQLNCRNNRVANSGNNTGLFKVLRFKLFGKQLIVLVILRKRNPVKSRTVNIFN